LGAVRRSSSGRSTTTPSHGALPDRRPRSGSEPSWVCAPSSPGGRPGGRIAEIVGLDVDDGRLSARKGILRILGKGEKVHEMIVIILPDRYRETGGVDGQADDPGQQGVDDGAGGSVCGCVSGGAA
jgi:hypothetical protein